MVSVAYSPAYAAAGHAFPTTRKARWIADSLAERFGAVLRSGS